MYSSLRKSEQKTDIMSCRFSVLYARKTISGENSSFLNVDLQQALEESSYCN